MIISVDKLLEMPEFSDQLYDVWKEKLKAVELLIRAYTNNNFQNRHVRFLASSSGDCLFATSDYLKEGDTVQISQSKVNDGLYCVKETLLNMIQTAVATQNEAIIYYLQKIIEILCDYFQQLLEALTGMGIVLDDGTLVGRLAPAMNTELGRIKMEEERGR